MNSSPQSALLFISLDYGISKSLPDQIYNQIKEAVLTGRLKPGARLPATRVLANQLAVSRNTVVAAFELLGSEDYLVSRPGSGTRITSHLPEELLMIRSQPKNPVDKPADVGKISKLSLHLGGDDNKGRHHTSGLRAFRPGLPDLEHFPFQLWSRIIGRFWRNPPRDLLSSGDVAGYLPLREAIADYLGAVRGVRCNADQVFITSGAQQAIDLVARTIIDPGDDVWVENPGYAGLSSALMAAGARVNHIILDEEGICIKNGRHKAAGAVLAAVTPSHQYPLGITMSLKRRLELLEWAEEANAWLLEDDFDSEFRYSGKPLSALQGLDQTNRVIYIGTFSKVLFPSLRLGYVVVPESLIDAIANIRLAVDDHPTLALQPALHAFISDGYFSSHIRKLRKLYIERQGLLISALRQYADGLLFAAPNDSGMHLVASINPSFGIDDKTASQRASNAGLIAPALSDYCTGISLPAALLLGYAGLSHREIDRDVRFLVNALRR
ncbi:MAG: PLP-dependent aminotransferase family protein [Hyphomicrobiales bacterium]|nr:PLP-dependent aminotransferase family protein [Hyphomicrobiales bacterium]